MKDIINRLRSLPLRTHRSISTILLFTGVVIGLIGYAFPDDPVVGIILCAVLAILIGGGIIWHMAFVKCPHCGHRFDLRSPVLRFCPNCGEKTEL